jgi:hypothetical protein
MPSIKPSGSERHARLGLSELFHLHHKEKIMISRAHGFIGTRTNEDGLARESQPPGDFKTEAFTGAGD